MPDFSQIYIDPLFYMPSRIPQARLAGEEYGHRWCHLWCDPGNEELLHHLAGLLGVRREWFQDRPRFPHYDLIPVVREAAIHHGATQIRLRDWLRGKNAASISRCASGEMTALL